MLTINLKTAMLSAGLIAASVYAPVQAKTLTIALDLSGSNPLLNDKQFNHNAAQYVADTISHLEKGDDVVVQSFGSLDNTANFNRFELPIKRHNAKKVAGQVAQYVRALPSNSQAQGSTNLIAWFGRNSFGCEAGGQVIVLTDAIEDVNPNHLIQGKQDLPKPNEFVQLKGCSVTFYGLGVGRLDSEMLNLRRAWTNYFESAGARFTAIAK